MKRTFAFALAIILALALASCAAGKTPRETPAPSDTPASSLAPTLVPTAVPTSAITPIPTSAPQLTAEAGPTAAPTAEPKPTAAPTQTQKPTAAPSQTEKPTAAPSQTEKPTAAPTQTQKPTAAPTQTEKPTAAPAQTQKPTAAPTAAPGESAISFTQSANLPLPSQSEDLPQGQPFCFGGVVRSEKPILSVTAVITGENGSGVISKSVSFSQSQNKKRVELVDPTFPKEGDASLSKKVKFEQLSSGSYVFSLYAEAVGEGTRLLYSSPFKVVGGEWRQLISNNLRNCYAYALSFFGSRDQFMFRYRFTDGRQIEVESGWLNARLTSVTAPSGQKWYVHKKAAPHYGSAINYMKTSYVRVRGTYDSGVVRLWDLVASFDGLLNTRFVTARDFVSHHAFGTAVDLNASMAPNRNVLTNRALILSEVRDKLVYNGIRTENGVSYYDFTYSGSYAEKHKNVPATVINYLLYELAFYRAGFSWGFYYIHACDAMHFGLSEMSADIHNTSDRSLRKVYSYIG